MTRVPATKWHPTPRAWHGTRGAPKNCVIHTIEGTADGAMSWFNSLANPEHTGAHLVIGRKQAYQLAELETLMYHAIGDNQAGVGLEHEGFASQTHASWVSNALRKQLRMSANRVGWICYHYKLGEPKRYKNVFGHVDLPGNDHTDPGKGFPWSFYMWLCRRAYKNLVKSGGKRWTLGKVK